MTRYFFKQPIRFIGLSLGFVTTHSTSRPSYVVFSLCSAFFFCFAAGSRFYEHVDSRRQNCEHRLPANKNGANAGSCLFAAEVVRMAELLKKLFFEVLRAVLGLWLILRFLCTFPCHSVPILACVSTSSFLVMNLLLT